MHRPAKLHKLRPPLNRMHRPAKLHKLRPPLNRMHMPAKLQKLRPTGNRMHRPAKLQMHSPSLNRMHMPAELHKVDLRCYVQTCEAAQAYPRFDAQTCKATLAYPECDEDLLTAYRHSDCLAILHTYTRQTNHTWNNLPTFFSQHNCMTWSRLAPSYVQVYQFIMKEI